MNAKLLNLLETSTDMLQRALERYKKCIIKEFT